MLTVLVGLIVALSNNQDELELQPISNTSEFVEKDNQSPKKILNSYPTRIPRPVTELHSEEAANLDTLKRLRIGWKYEGTLDPPKELQATIVFLELLNRNTPGIEEMKKLGRVDLRIPLGQTVGVDPPFGCNSVAFRIGTQGVTQLASEKNLETWPFFQRFSISSSATASEEIVLRISGSATVSGVVINEETRRPEPEVKISLFREDEQLPIAVLVTGEDGAFEFKSIPDGFYGLITEKGGAFVCTSSDLWSLRIRTISEGMRSFRKDESFFDRTIGPAGALVVRLCGARSINGLILPLGEPAQIAGVVRDWEGKAVPDFYLTATLDETSTLVEVKTDNNGSFNIPNCPLGNWKIFLGRKNEASELNWPVTTRTNTTSHVALSLPKPKRVRVIAESMDGVPVPNVTFYIYKPRAAFGKLGGIQFPKTNGRGETELSGIIDTGVLVCLAPDLKSRWVPVDGKKSPKKIVRFGGQDVETVKFKFVRAARFLASLDFHVVAKDLPEGDHIKGFMVTFSANPKGPEVLQFNGDKLGEIDGYFKEEGPIFIRSVTVYLNSGKFIRCRVREYADIPLIADQKRSDLLVVRKK